MEPIAFLDAISGYVRTSTGRSSDRPIKIAKVASDYDPWVPPYPDATPPARVTFEGESAPSGKAYPIASGYVPQPNARVYLVPIGNSWLIVGAVTQYTTQGFSAAPDGSYFGVEFGDGSYFDTESGLHLLTDAEIEGDLTVGGIGAMMDVVKGTDTSRLSNALLDDPELKMTLTAGRWKIEFDIIMAGTTGDIMTSWNVGGTVVGPALKTCWGPSPWTIDTGTPDETQDRNAVPMRVGVHGFTTGVAYGMNSLSAYTSAREWAIINFTTTATVALQWGQDTTTTGTGNETVVRANSSMHARRIA